MSEMMSGVVQAGGLIVVLISVEMSDVVQTFLVLLHSQEICM